MDKGIEALQIEIEEGEADDDDLAEDRKIIHSGDAQLAEPAVTSITATKSINAGDVLDVTDVGTEMGEVEEAQEAIEEPAALIERSLAFEIKFTKKNIFQQYVHGIVEALEAALNVNEEECLKFEFSIENEVGGLSKGEEIHLVRAYMVQTDHNEVPQSSLSVCEEVEDTVTESIQSNKREESPDVDISSLFTIDTSGSKKLNTDCVPSYKRAIKDVLDEDSIECKRKKQMKADECQRVRQAASCFNCGANDHSVRDCHKPRNNARIQRAKKAKKQERYHIDIEQRFGHIRPGEISDKLKSALGLRRGELPFFYYRMRKFGYPPGWLEEAKVINSGITLFNSDGHAVKKSDDEGSQDKIEHKYDISKIISFPGFNMDPGRNFYDDYKHHNVPPMNQNQMKEEFIKSLGENVVKGYKRKKLKNLPSTSKRIESEHSTSVLEMTDMEIEDVHPEKDVIFCRPPLPPEPDSYEKYVAPPLPTSPPPDNIVTPAQGSNQISPTNNSSSEDRSKSPSLADLEARKQKLLAELTSGAVERNSPEITRENMLEEVESNAPNVNLATPEAKHKCTSSTTFASPSTPISIESKRTDIIKESHMGTPVLKFSPYDKLPVGDNFKVGVSDVINFENLPDSTGKYEQMKNVIKKVRTVITKLQNDDDDH